MTSTEGNDAALTDDPERWARVGRSTDADSLRAGNGAASEATDTDTASLYVVFVGHRHDYEAVIAGVTAAAPAGAVVVGCTTGGEIAVGGPSDDGVVVMALGGPGISVAARVADIVGDDLRTPGEDVADAIWDVEDRGHTVLLLLSDGLAGDQQEVVQGAHAAVGGVVPIVGGCAGDGMEMSRTALFHATSSETRIGARQVIGVAISSTAPMGVGVFHGWQQAGEPVLVTQSIGSVVLRMDDEPALDCYLRLLGAPTDLADDADAFAAFAATHPIGISQRGGEEVRYIVSADPIERTITTASPVPQGVVAYAMEGSADSVLDATDVACRDALARLTGPPVALLAFDCVARRSVLGDDGAIAEINLIEERVGAPLAGFYSYGEFAHVESSGGFHNQTLVTLAIG